MTRYDEALANQGDMLAGMMAIVRKNHGQGVKFERIRRITGYLAGTLDRFNNAKRAEERDRVKHG